METELDSLTLAWPFAVPNFAAFISFLAFMALVSVTSEGRWWVRGPVALLIYTGRYMLCMPTHILTIHNVKLLKEKKEEE